MSLLLLLAGPAVVVEAGTIDGASAPLGPALVAVSSDIVTGVVVEAGTIDGASAPPGPTQVYAPSSSGYRPW